ncbi:MAG: gluconate 2-dehydrogenase subunit 3 family protein [Saprospiraceae bacterium]|nr:gluconate 2-dehydrogenase subunit 3 family protein [Saprospiraceae bacterium]
MDRRENLKLLLTGTLATGFLISTGCKDSTGKEVEEMLPGLGYGRTPEEIAHDLRLKGESFFSDKERKMVEILCDIIIPEDEESVSATEAGVPDFIEFMMKDYPKFQVPMRGGLMWLNSECNKRFESDFLSCTDENRINVIEDIAYPDTAKAEMKPGVTFFNLIRNLTATGYFTSEEGIEYLRYAGNRPNEWDGVPDEVLRKHGLSYDQRTLDISIKSSERNTIAVWDDQGNLVG